MHGIIGSRKQNDQKKKKDKKKQGSTKHYT